MGLCRMEKISLTVVCVFVLGVWDMNMFESPQASTCADICLKLSLLSSPAVPHFICLSALGFHTDDKGPRCSAMRGSSNPPFFDTWQIINGGLAALRWNSEGTHQIRCLTAHVHTDKNLHLAIFMRLFHHSSWLCDLALSRVFAGHGYICLIKLKRRLSHKLSFNMSLILFITTK